MTNTNAPTPPAPAVTAAELGDPSSVHYDPVWKDRLRALSDKLMSIPPNITGIDQTELAADVAEVLHYFESVGLLTLLVPPVEAAGVVVQPPPLGEQTKSSRKKLTP